MECMPCVRIGLEPQSRRDFAVLLEGMYLGSHLRRIRVLKTQNQILFFFFTQDQVFPAFSTLICNSPNFKVRTNAAWALSSCNHYGKYTVMLWKSIVLAFENAQHVPSYVEYPHRDALIQQASLLISTRVAFSRH